MNTLNYVTISCSSLQYLDGFGFDYCLIVIILYGFYSSIQWIKVYLREMNCKVKRKHYSRIPAWRYRWIGWITWSLSKWSISNAFHNMPWKPQWPIFILLNNVPNSKSYPFNPHFPGIFCHFWSCPTESSCNSPLVSYEYALQKIRCSPCLFENSLKSYYNSSHAEHSHEKFPSSYRNA